MSKCFHALLKVIQGNYPILNTKYIVHSIKKNKGAGILHIKLRFFLIVTLNRWEKILPKLKTAGILCNTFSVASKSSKQEIQRYYYC